MSDRDHRRSKSWEVEPWSLSRRGLALDELAGSETLFTLANGHIGVRGTLDEGEPRSAAGTFVNGFYEERTLPYAEEAYGYPKAGQTVVNVPDGTLIRLFVGDTPFDVRYGTAEAHHRTLDLRAGTLDRETRWRAPNGAAMRVRSRRLVSFEHRSLMAIQYEVEALDTEVLIALQSDLLANESGGPESEDPRDAAVLERPLVSELAVADGTEAVLVHRTRRSQLRIASGIDHILEPRPDDETTIEARDDMARYTITTRLRPGHPLRLVKLVAYGWSHRRGAAALRDQVEAALAIGRLTGWEGLEQGQRAYLERFWDGADVELDGDDALQQAVRVSMFHVLQSAARAEGRGIAAKGLSGVGYDGHTFWDADTFTLPMLIYTAPHAARGHLQWRHATLPFARDRARELKLDGAAFAWRTINGQECSGYWPAGTAAFHVNSAIADATARYLAVTRDTEFETECGVELLVETARLWASFGHIERGRFRLDGVTGPDEYTAVVDDNIYTDLMAQRNLREAAAACERRPEVASRLGVDDHEVRLWREAADAVTMDYDDELGVHPQSFGFTSHEEWDFEGTTPDEYPLLLHFPYFQLYRKQVIKQADLVLALHLRGDAFTPDEKARNFAYYEARTVRDSSLSAGTQAIIAAETGHLDLAYEYWAEVAFVDIGDLHGNVDDGLHIASMGSAWLTAVAGFGGMRDHDGVMTFAPRLPAALDRIAFRLGHLGSRIHVEILRTDAGEVARYTVVDGPGLSTSHHGDPLDLEPGVTVEIAIPAAPEPAPVTQPAGRAPLHWERTAREES
ncbi:MAG: family 65 glycosyl hydrolase [Actinomycetota bacterium]|nr:family 65 glycosyl hydrolase [Actinomycetota bacterium]